jgi:hypothetical protein
MALKSDFQGQSITTARCYAAYTLSTTVILSIGLYNSQNKQFLLSRDLHGLLRIHIWSAVVGSLRPELTRKILTRTASGLLNSKVLNEQ